MCLPQKTHPEIFGENLERCCTRARKFLPHPFKIQVLQNEKSLHGYMLDQCLAKKPHSKSASGSGARSGALPSRSGTPEEASNCIRRSPLYVYPGSVPFSLQREPRRK